MDIIELNFFLISFNRNKPQVKNIITHIKTKISLFSKPQPSTRSTLDKNLNANASSIKPNKTFTELVQDPDFGSLVTILGKIANKVNGNELSLIHI